MILAAAVCPHPPLLFRELGGARDAVAPLRAACRDAVRDALVGADRVVLVGGADTAGSWDPGLPPDVRRFGTTGPRAATRGLPLSLGVGRRLLDAAGWSGPVEALTVAWDATAAQVDAAAEELAGRPERLALVVLGDGSTRRGEKAPGFLDARAFPFDDELAAALGAGAARDLVRLDPALAGELMVLGRAAFGVLGAVSLAEGREVTADLRFRDDPFGVSYFVALWSFGERPGAGSAGTGTRGGRAG